MPGHTLSKPINDRSEPRPLEKTALPIDSRAQLATRTAFAILLVLLALWVASDFLSAMVWAAVNRHHDLAGLHPIRHTHLR